MSEYSPEPKFSRANVKVELNLSNHATKADLKNATGVDTSNIAKKTDLLNLKYYADKLDIDKFKNVRSGLNSLRSKVDKTDIGKLEPTRVISNVVKYDVVN